MAERKEWLSGCDGFYVVAEFVRSLDLFNAGSSPERCWWGPT